MTLTGWDESQPEIARFFQESRFAQFKCGLTDNGPVPEPQPGGDVAVSISLRVDDSLEPKWSVVKGRDEDEQQERKPIYAADRAVLGLSRLDVLSDLQFTWARNSLLTHLSTANEANLNTILAALIREMRQMNISADQGIMACQSIADTILTEAQQAGVRLAALSPKLDVQRQSRSAGAISLHEENVPLRSKGSGSKKLIAAAMQMKLHGGKNIALIDELETGLEPHRIRGLIHRLRRSSQQIFTTTHSPVVLRDLTVADDELYVCQRDRAGTVQVKSLAAVPGIQGPVRATPKRCSAPKSSSVKGSPRSAVSGHTTIFASIRTIRPYGA